MRRAGPSVTEEQKGQVSGELEGVGIRRPEQTCRAHRRSLRGGVGPRAIVDLFGLQGPALRRGREGKGDTKAGSVEARRVWAWKT